METYQLINDKANDLYYNFFILKINTFLRIVAVDINTQITLIFFFMPNPSMIRSSQETSAV